MELDPIALYQSDSMELMRNMSPESVDLIVSDVPYKVISGGKSRGRTNDFGGILKANDGKIFAHNDVDHKEMFELFYKILKKDTHCYVFVNEYMRYKFETAAYAAGFKMHALLIPKKSNCVRNRWYRKNYEIVMFLRKGKAKGIKNQGSKQCHDFGHVPKGEKTHKTEKPVSLMQLYVENSSETGDIVMDPFMGTGSTGIACLRTGRKFIGAEIDPEYFVIAQQRIQSELDVPIDVGTPYVGTDDQKGAE